MKRFWPVAGTLGLILVLTLFPNDARRSPDGFWCLRCSGYASHADLILNVLLFVPFGLSLRRAGIALRVAIAAVVASTVAIELIQLLFIPGRDATVRDCITNSIGGTCGVAAYPWFQQLWNPGRSVARVLASFAALVWTAHAALTIVAYRPAATPAAYYGQVMLTQEGFNPFRGRVERPALNGISISTDALSPAATAAARSLGALTISLDVLPETTTYGIAPIVKIADGNGQEIAMVAQHRDAALVRMLMRANRLGLRAPSLDLPGALTPGRLVHLSAGRDEDVMWIEASQPDATRDRSELRLTPSIGWSLWWPFEMYSTSRLKALTWTWLTIPMFVIAFWTTRASGGGSGRLGQKALGPAVAVFICAAVSQVVVPLALGGAMTTDPLDAVAIATGSVGGILLGLTRRGE